MPSKHNPVFPVINFRRKIRKQSITTQPSEFGYNILALEKLQCQALACYSINAGYFELKSSGFMKHWACILAGVILTSLSACKSFPILPKKSLFFRL
jgi:hypothetical protein